METKTKKLSIPSKEERLEMAKKSDKSELEIYLSACEKAGRKPAPSAVKRAKALKEGK